MRKIGRALWALLLIAGCSNPSTPAGHVGYCVHGAFVGRDSFYGMQTGPTSTGLGWLLSCSNVPVTPLTFDEPFTGDSAILSKDNLTISFAVHTVLRVKPEGVRTLVEQFSAGGDPVQRAYKEYVQAPLRTFARNELQKFESFAIKDNIEKESAEIEAKVKSLTANTPFDIVQVVVGNIQYPPQVAEAVSKKMAAAQLLEQQDTNLKIKQKEAEQRVAEAHGIADAQHIINATLTDQYLQHEAIEAQKLSIASPNHTTIYIPIGPMGVPMVGSLSMGK